MPIFTNTAPSSMIAVLLVRYMFRTNSLLWPKEPVICGYAIAVLTVAAALVISLWPAFHLQIAPLSLFLCVVMVTAWFGEIRPGLVAITVSALAFSYYFLPLTPSLSARPDEIARLVSFAIAALCAASLRNGAPQNRSGERRLERNSSTAPGSHGSSMGDHVELQPVLMNLMINGIDAMKDAGGTCELTIRSQGTESEKIVLGVTDSDVGLPPRRADQIFNAFFTTKPNGTGMGFRISRSIIESHGGRLWVADNSPRGATFYFTLPTKAEAHE